MSSLERNKGTLNYVGSVPDYIGGMDECEFSDWLSDRSLIRVGQRIFKVNYEVKSDQDCSFFADYHIDFYGTIHFHTMHYNGGGSLVEVLESMLKED
ncbi:MAG: hypothetical protein GOVbin1096_98 [Prokaryotic dsDNA virus sp.]|jgi:hypothetical protein|nr:MAG: hypothetical protein GOVbin1096_98 [Prokaryotic dsDNA virus sp.]|tara:strand:+ start:21095 stop:21385 length:291 start_codon:yes stop_codon:yes gene_type:complete